MLKSISWMAEGWPGPLGPAAGSPSSTVPTEHHCVLTGRRHPWVPFSVFLPLQDWQDLALDSRRA